MNDEMHFEQLQAEGHLRSAEHKAHEAAMLKGQRDETRRKLDAMRRREPEVYFSGRALEWYFIAFLAPAAAFCIDFVIMSAPVEYLATFVGIGHGDPLLWGFRVLMPAAVIAVEIGIAARMYLARNTEGVLETLQRGSRAKGAIWFAFGLIMSMVMPLLGAATFLNNEGVSAVSELDQPFLFLLLGIVFLTWIAHVAILFSGEGAHKGKVRLRMTRLRRKEERLQRAYDAAARASERHFQMYREAVDRYNRAYGPSHTIPLYAIHRPERTGAYSAPEDTAGASFERAAGPEGTAPERTAGRGSTEREPVEPNPRIDLPGTEGLSPNGQGTEEGGDAQNKDV